MTVARDAAPLLRSAEESARHVVRKQALPPPAPEASFDAAIVLTLVSFLLFGPSPAYVKGITAFLCVLGLAVRRLQRSQFFWAGLLALLVWAVAAHWYSADNHKFLMCYWTLAILLALRAGEPSASLRISARALLAGVMVFGVLQKLLSADYLSHGFFAHTLLLDSRFREVAALLGLTPEIVAQNQNSLNALADSLDPDHMAIIAVPPNLLFVARMLGIWTLGIEAALAGVFLLLLLKPGGRSRIAADGLLLTFVLTTYAIANVLGFGGLLAAMGAAQAENRWSRTAYLVAVAILQLYALPLARLV